MEKEKITTKKTINGLSKTLPPNQETFFGTLLLEDLDGELDAKHQKITAVTGDVMLTNSYIKYLPNLQTIGGNLILKNSKIKYFDHLIKLGGSLVLDNSEILSLYSLQTIKHSLCLSDSKILWLNNLQTVNTINLENAYIAGLAGLDSCNGLTLTNSEIDVLPPKFKQPKHFCPSTEK